MGGTTRRIWGRGRTSFALLTSLVVLSSFFIVAGAQVASAAQCSQAGSGAGCHLAFRFEDPAKSGSYIDTSPHQAGITKTITNTDLDPTAHLVTVEVEDGLGRRDTSYAGLISINLVSGSGLSGNTPTAAVDGAASFTLSIGNAGYFQLTATVSETAIAPVTSAAFRIQKSVCETGDMCTDSFGTLMDASLTNTGRGTVALSVGIDSLSDCSAIPGSDQVFGAPMEWTVDEVRATSPSTKLLVIRIDKSLRQFVENGKVLNRSVQLYRPCITATVPPPPGWTWNNTRVISETSGEFTFLGADCDKTIMYWCRAYSKSSKVGDVVQGISLPSGITDLQGNPIDPRGH